MGVATGTTFGALRGGIKGLPLPRKEKRDRIWPTTGLPRAPVSLSATDGVDLGSFIGYEKDGLKVTIALRRQSDQSVTVHCRFANALDASMTGFVFDAAVPTYVQLLKMYPASGQMLPPRSETVSQQMSIINTTSGEKPVLMKLRIGYYINGQQVQETVLVSNFPQGI